MRLVLVDDEPIVLAGLESILREHSEAFPIAALCGSGEEALIAVRRERPDIVITDIRMGGMSGLELAEKIKALDERIVVILLTGYSEFAFAQKALTLDVFEYLVKPTRHTDILSCLERAAKKRERLMGASIATREQPALSPDDQTASLIRDALAGTAPPETLREAGQPFMAEARAYFVMDVLMEPAATNPARDTYTLNQSLRGLFSKAFSGDGRLLFVPDGIGSLILVAFTAEAGESAAQQIAGRAGVCVRDALRLLDTQLVVGLSGERQDLAELPLAYAEAVNARNSAAKSGHSFSSYPHRRAGEHSPSVKKALGYIHEHYTGGVSLKDVSQHVFLNAWYFSELFKKEVGKPFTDYILELRIRRAKELIADRRLPLYQISYMVGINSPTYFSQVFKKATGLTPKEYRKKL